MIISCALGQRAGARRLLVLARTAFPRAAPCPSRALHATSAAAQKKADHYSVLGLSKGAEKEEIKKAYYKLVKKCGRGASSRAATPRLLTRTPPSAAVSAGTTLT